MIRDILRHLGFGGFASSHDDEEFLEALTDTEPDSFHVTDSGALYRADHKLKQPTEVNEFHMTLASILPRRAYEDLHQLARDKNTTEMNRLLTCIAKEKEVRKMLNDGGQFYVRDRDGNLKPINLDF
ncbi:hypothetical protein [Paraburkholderia fungorum]|jgi:hypothetical protein|uniref:hypothetical protein n=1 Tax=Paraburkholderia fungorum TaxID=134537 RepID=UPI000D04F8F2|nr:hypothetical protein [Paraburkholderia fungorum]PRZ50675.1 hypothetical protein BX589_124113 [Paraburkholderia fungorum]